MANNHRRPTILTRRCRRSQGTSSKLAYCKQGSDERRRHCEAKGRNIEGLVSPSIRLFVLLYGCSEICLDKQVNLCCLRFTIDLIESLSYQLSRPMTRRTEHASPVIHSTRPPLTYQSLPPLRVPTALFRGRFDWLCSRKCSLSGLQRLGGCIGYMRIYDHNIISGKEIHYHAIILTLEKFLLRYLRAHH